MEKQIRFTRGDIIKWIGFIAVVISSFTANQMDIQYLKRQNEERKQEIIELAIQNAKLCDDLKTYGETVANLNGKLDEIQGTVNSIKNAIFSNQFNTRHE